MFSTPRTRSTNWFRVSGGARIAMFSAWVLNPYQQLLVRRLRALALDVEERPFSELATLAPRSDLVAVHIHGLPFRVGPDLASLHRGTAVLHRLARLRASGTAVVWTPHDFRSHGTASRTVARIDRIARNLMARVASGVHVHSAYEYALWRNSGVSSEKLILAAHGHYIGHYPETIRPADARTALGLRSGDLVFGFFGWLRRNKGLPELLSVFSHFDDDSARLLIAGTPEDAAIADVVARAQARDARIVARLAPVPKDEVQIYLQASDVMVLPYHASVATSGAAVLAASFGKCCIATRTANLDTLLDEKNNFLLPRAEPQALLDAMRLAAKQRDELPARGARNRQRVEQDDWSATAATLRAHYLRPLALALRQELPSNPLSD